MDLRNFFDHIEHNVEITKQNIDNKNISKFFKQFRYLAKLIDRDGRFYDPILNSSLDFQYHYPFILISWLLLKKLINMDDFESNIYNSFEYWEKLPKKITDLSLEFNNFALCLSYALIKFLNKQKNIDKQFYLSLENKIKNMKHNSYEKLIPLNNNFKALTAFNLFLQGKLIENYNMMDEGISLMKSKIIKYQMDDGFFPDTNMNKNHTLEKNNGVPNLTYHSKISMLVALLGIFSEDREILRAAIKAFNNIIDIASKEGEICFYGRSQNAIFGYGCVFLGLNILYSFVEPDQQYMNLSNMILDLIFKYQYKSGFFAINLNKTVYNRPGFDNYMYPVVYNTYSNALFLFGLLINSDLLKDNKEIEKKKEKSRIIFNKDSGFLKVKENDLEFCLNVKGHINCYKYYMDSRIAPLSLLYLSFNNNSLIPSIPMRYNQVSSKACQLHRFEEIKNIFKNLKYHVAIGGYQPYFQDNSIPFFINLFFNKIININSYFLNKLISYDIKTNEIKLEYSLKEYNSLSVFFIIINQFLKYFKSKNKKNHFNNKCEVVLNWKTHSINYIINCPSNMNCIFPLRFYDDIFLEKVGKKLLVLKYHRITFRIQTNIKFKLLKSNKVFFSGKGKVKLFYLKFFQSGHIKIQIVIIK